MLLFLMMLLTFADVVARYLFNRPIRGGFEITELTLLVLIFAGLPLVSHADEHVTMDFIDRLLPPRGAGRVDPRDARHLRGDHVLPHLAGLDQGRRASPPTAIPPTCCASPSARSSTSWR